MSLITSLLPGANGTSPLLSAYKSADEVVNNSATLQADDALLVAVEADTKYLVDLFLIYDASTTADLRVGWNVPAGSTFNWSSAAMALTGSGGTNVGIRLVQTGAAGSETIGGAGVGSLLTARLRGVLVTAGTAGDLGLTWAQVAAEETAATVRAGSLLTAQRLA